MEVYVAINFHLFLSPDRNDCKTVNAKDKSGQRVIDFCQIPVLLGDIRFFYRFYNSAISGGIFY